jgi:hypothetical protein
MSDEIVEATKWPETEDAATADALILHGARITVAWQERNAKAMREVYAFDREDPDRKPAMRNYIDGVTAMIAEGQLVISLVEVQKRSREQADELAKHLWGITEDGGALGELMWQYLDERGVDAETVFQAARVDE